MKEILICLGITLFTMFLGMCLGGAFFLFTYYLIGGSNG
jgi:hypothetical protein